MVPNIYEKIISKLISRTSKGEVNWNSTTDGNTYIVNFKEYSIAITRGIDYEQNEFIKFQIKNIEGKTVDDFFVDENDLLNWDNTLQLFNNARRKALKINEAIDIIVKELDSGDVVGVEKDISTVDLFKDL